MKNLLCKYKQLLIGITIGSLITAIPVGAAVQEYILYKSECTLINSDGTKYEDADYPVLSYKGSNYVSIGKVSQFLGVPFTWEGNTKTAKFEKPLASNTQNTKEGGVSVDTKTPLPDLTVPEINNSSINSNKNELTINNIPTYEYQGEKYVLYTDAYFSIILKQYKGYYLNSYEMRKENQGKQILYFCDDKGIIKEFPYSKIQVAQNDNKDIAFSYNNWINDIVPIITNQKTVNNYIVVYK